jgi:ubiquinone/menaquinone biosynthesis C-methylase UbiE
MEKYQRNIAYWNAVFQKIQPKQVETRSTGQVEVDAGLDWLCSGSKTLLDFGCGSGTMLFKCSLRGTQVHIGIDNSSQGIELAKASQELMTLGEFTFIVGGADYLKNLPDHSIDGVILSNILDNLIPDDAHLLLKQVQRILVNRGKVFLKLNPYLTDEQIQKWDIKVIEGNFLDDGLFLWNQTTEEWRALLTQYFSEVDFKDIYYPEHDQYNRLFLLVNSFAS